MDTEELNQAFSNSISENAENIMPNNTNGALQYSQVYNVKIPKPAEKIALDVSSIRMIKEKCEKAKKERFSFAELLSSIASLLLGAFLSAVITGITYELSFNSILFYTICPVGGFSCGVAYLFCRKKETKDIKQFAEKIEECIPNIDENEEIDNK